MQNVARFDRGLVKKATTVTDEGYLRADAIVTRTGVFNYINADGTIRKELRHPNDVFNKESMDSMRMRPVTNGHPAQKLVNAKNYKKLSVGYTGESVNTDGQYVMTSILVTDENAINDIKNNNKRELSLGYTVNLIKEDGVYNGETYTHRQTNIKYNHLAIVDYARAGSEARIHLDGSSAEEVINDEDLYLLENVIIHDNVNHNNLKHGGSKIMDEKFSIVTLDGLEYKAAPEVANAYKKFESVKSELNIKIDSLTKELETLKAEKDDYKTKLDEANAIDHEAKLKEAVKSRVNLISKAKNIVKEEINMDEMSDKEIKISVIRVKRPKINLDEASDIYIDAAFDLIVEDSIDVKSEDSESIKKQREALITKNDKSETKVVDAEEARKKYIDRIQKAYQAK